MRVLRLHPDAALVLFNGDGCEYPARFLDGERRAARVLAGDASGTESSLRIALAQGIARGERMNYVVQKAAELGVGCVVPLLTERSVVRLDGTGRATCWIPRRRTASRTRGGTTARGIVLLIGPEGGLSPAERARTYAAGFRGVRLGPRVLRTETATVA